MTGIQFKTGTVLIVNPDGTHTEIPVNNVTIKAGDLEYSDRSFTELIDGTFDVEHTFTIREGGVRHGKAQHLQEIRETAGVLEGRDRMARGPNCHLCRQVKGATYGNNSKHAGGHRPKKSRNQKGKR